LPDLRQCNACGLLSGVIEPAYAARRGVATALKNPEGGRQPSLRDAGHI